MTLLDWMHNPKTHVWFAIGEAYIRKSNSNDYIYTIVNSSSIGFFIGKNVNLTSRGLLKVLTLRGLCP
jgi:hypothetical protein